MVAFVAGLLALYVFADVAEDVCALLLVLVLLIGISRLYLGLHFLSDVIAGYAAGFLWADAVLVAGIRFERSTGTLTE